MQPSADTAAVLAPDRARRFLIQAALWNVTLFALLRLPWIEQHLIGALVEFQRVLVAWYRPAPAGVVVNASCSGADVMALCAGIAIAYPTTWRKRVWGATCGVLLILALNCVRIAWLFALAPDAARLQLWHVYLWPVLLSAAVLLYVLAWIRWAEGTRRLGGWGRFAATAGVGLAVYAAIVPWAFTSPALHDAAKWTAAIAAALLAPFAATAHASGAMLVTDRGLFLVTQECLFTPMLPLYAALVLSVPMPWRRRALALLAAVPIFLLLGVARVLVLALPPYIVSSPLVLAHGFYQLVAGGAILIGAAHLRLGRDAGTRATQATIAALAIAIGTGVALGGGWTWLVRHVAEGARWLLPATFASFSHPADAQGALALLPAFQFSLLVGLWFAITGGARRGTLAGALAALAASQVGLLAALGIVSSDGGLPHALAIRAWAIAVPVGLAIVFRRPAATTVGDPGYQDFWHGVGAEFPVLTGAASTDFYFENEQRLLRESLPPLAGLKLLKTDLWDEAKNTRILQWAADQGAAVYGLDLSEPIIRQAQSAFGPARRLRPVMSDVRRLPFADESFDAVYSMGTVEHFAETGPSVTELARVLRPGGRLVLGVPNRHDPFLRPLMVAALNAVGLYGYGYERSFSRRALRRMLEEAGLRVRMESGILFIPGWLRMLDLWCFTRARPLARVTAQLVRPFAWLERHAPALRRHGYLIASVGEKPVREGPGVHYLIDARGCDAAALCSLPRLQALFARIIDELSLTVVAPPVWHVFPGTGGITGMVLLGESHLTIHTFPESDRAAIDLYCCRRSADWEWAENLRQALGAGDVTVRVIRRCDIPFNSSTLREE